MGARLAAEMLNTMTYIQEHAGKITLPLLMLHGEEDTLAAAEGSKFLNDHVGIAGQGTENLPGTVSRDFQ